MTRAEIQASNVAREQLSWSDVPVVSSVFQESACTVMQTVSGLP
jgi:hypothetical protein